MLCTSVACVAVRLSVPNYSSNTFDYDSRSPGRIGAALPVSRVRSAALMSRLFTHTLLSVFDTRAQLNAHVHNAHLNGLHAKPPPLTLSTLVMNRTHDNTNKTKKDESAAVTSQQCSTPLSHH